jgi:N-acetyl sugar amidotransferase
MPDTKPGISFKDGVCNACQHAEKNDNTDWDERWRVLQSIADEHKGQGYNVLVPVSGGKDSTFLAMTARKLGLHPLCVNVAPCEPTARGERNLANLSLLGFDVMRFMPNAKIMPKLVKRSFVEDGDPCTSHEFMLYSVPLKVAMNFGIPLIMWAENSQTEYGNFDLQCGLWGRDHTHWICDGVTEEDLTSFYQPTEQEIKDSGIKALYLSDYVRWDSRKVGRFAVKHGLEPRPESELLGTGGYWAFEQLDDEAPVIGHYMKYLKFGYGRATDQACRDIRLGYIDRPEGLRLAMKYDGHLNFEYIKRFCKYIGISVPEFHEIAETFRNNPVIIGEKHGKEKTPKETCAT